VFPSPADGGSPATTCPFDKRIQWALAYMEDNLHHRLSINQLAGKVNLSYWHFCRLFRRETGICPAHYLKLSRMCLGKKLLEQTFLSVKEIAAQVGMDDSCFVRTFRSVYGLPPGHYRSAYATENHQLLHTSFNGIAHTNNQ
jgi:transcriptional regulator GlxA family with amidase domain